MQGQPGYFFCADAAYSLLRCGDGWDWDYAAGTCDKTAVLPLPPACQCLDPDSPNMHCCEGPDGANDCFSTWIGGYDPVTKVSGGFVCLDTKYTYPMCGDGDYDPYDYIHHYDRNHNNTHDNDPNNNDHNTQHNAHADHHYSFDLNINVDHHHANDYYYDDHTDDNDQYNYNTRHYTDDHSRDNNADHYAYDNCQYDNINYTEPYDHAYNPSHDNNGDHYVYVNDGYYDNTDNNHDADHYVYDDNIDYVDNAVHDDYTKYYGFVVNHGFHHHAYDDHLNNNSGDYALDDDSDHYDIRDGDDSVEYNPRNKYHDRYVNTEYKHNGYEHNSHKHADINTSVYSQYRYNNYYAIEHDRSGNNDHADHAKQDVVNLNYTLADHCFDHHTAYYT
ncbi:hypothetical protein AAVH_15598 [Aphelenchoides avenae]|nr:hypothetical protein AAVH_15598 [Aphelenchus avenae]